MRYGRPRREDGVRRRDGKTMQYNGDRTELRQDNLLNQRFRKLRADSQFGRGSAWFTVMFFSLILVAWRD